MFKSIATFVGVLTGVILLFCFLDLTGVFWESKIGVYRENVRRQVFEQTRSFNESKLQELVKDRNEYLHADEKGKDIIASTVRQAFAAYNDKDLNSDLRSFLSECMTR